MMGSDLKRRVESESKKANGRRKKNVEISKRNGLSHDTKQFRRGVRSSLRGITDPR